MVGDVIEIFDEYFDFGIFIFYWFLGGKGEFKKVI